MLLVKQRENSSEWSHLDCNKTVLKEALLGFNVDFFFYFLFVCLDEDYREITCPIVFRGSANRMIAGGRGSATGKKLLLPPLPFFLFFFTQHYEKKKVKNA